jgi:hypothetical protein
VITSCFPKSSHTQLGYSSHMLDHTPSPGAGEGGDDPPPSQGEGSLCVHLWNEDDLDRVVDAFLQNPEGLGNLLQGELVGDQFGPAQPPLGGQ